MANRLEVFSCTVPAGTGSNAPATFANSFPDGEVVGVELVIPDGAAGIVGIMLTFGGDQVLPNTAGAFILGNDVTLRYPMERYPTGGRWQLRAYNLGQYPHLVQVRYQVVDFGFTAAPLVEPLVLP